MKFPRVSGVLTGSVVIALVSLSSRHVAGAPPHLPATAAAEPITGTPARSAPSEHVHAHAPFTPYDVGPKGSTWSYAQLTPAEQAAAVRATERMPSRQTHDAFARASAERARRADGEAAAHELGVESLATIGVVR